jgi:hypothetical protein
MKRVLLAGLALLGLAQAQTCVLAQTAGSAHMQITLNDYGPSGTRHWTVVWVTYENGTFIKSLRKQGPSWTSTHWDSHCRVWNTARGGSASGSQSLDGYSSATAPDYTGTNSPIVWSWNCRDANNVLVPDGNYKLWIQYAEDSGQGPHTTNGLAWTKGPIATTNTYPSMGANFTNLRLVWTPSTPAAVPPTITSAAPTSAATVGVPYQYTCAASGTAPIGFSASGLPPGLAISSAGVISGTPTSAGTFPGTITATNGTLPNATQSFSIAVTNVPASIGAVSLSGTDLILSGRGPANGTYSVLVSTNSASTAGQWNALATGNFDAAGQFRFTNSVNPNVPQQFYRLRVP